MADEYYLAHPLDLRKKVRKEELRLEAITGISLVNPFYDIKRFDVKAIDAGEITRWDHRLDYKGIVQNDLSLIDKYRKVVAYAKRGALSIGTICEMWHARTSHYPILLVTADLHQHPWMRYMILGEGSYHFLNWDDLIEYFLKGGR